MPMDLPDLSELYQRLEENEEAKLKALEPLEANEETIENRIAAFLNAYATSVLSDAKWIVEPSKDPQYVEATKGQYRGKYVAMLSIHTSSERKQFSAHFFLDLTSMHDNVEMTHRTAIARVEEFTAERYPLVLKGGENALNEVYNGLTSSKGLIGRWLERREIMKKIGSPHYDKLVRSYAHVSGGAASG